MSDEEVIASFMEPKPTKAALSMGRPLFSVTGWWSAGSRPHREWDEWYPITLTLDALRQVQERLTEEQWEQYECEMLALWTPGTLRHGLGEVQHYLHATAEQKIRALAVVLRTEGQR